MKQLQVGLVGYGLAGRAFHARLIGATPGLRLSAVATSSPERAREAALDWPAVAVVSGVEHLLKLRDLDLSSSRRRTTPTRRSPCARSTPGSRW